MERLAQWDSLRTNEGIPWSRPDSAFHQWIGAFSLGPSGASDRETLVIVLASKETENSLVN
jgi:hypothetical protein